MRPLSCGHWKSGICSQEQNDTIRNRDRSERAVDSERWTPKGTGFKCTNRRAPRLALRPTAEKLNPASLTQYQILQPQWWLHGHPSRCPYSFSSPTVIIHEWPLSSWNAAQLTWDVLEAYTTARINNCTDIDTAYCNNSLSILHYLTSAAKINFSSFLLLFNEIARHISITSAAGQKGSFRSPLAHAYFS